MRTQLSVQVPLKHSQSSTSRSFSKSQIVKPVSICSAVAGRSLDAERTPLHLLFLYRSLTELRVKGKQTSVYCTEWWAWTENLQKSEISMTFASILLVTYLSFLFFGTLSPILITPTLFPLHHLEHPCFTILLYRALAPIFVSVVLHQFPVSWHLNLTFRRASWKKHKYLMNEWNYFKIRGTV